MTTLIVSRPFHGLHLRPNSFPSDESLGYFHVIRFTDFVSGLLLNYCLLSDQRSCFKSSLAAVRTHTQSSERRLVSLIITGVREQAPLIRSFDLMPVGANATHGIKYIPGQVAVLQVPGEEPAYFALASAPEDTALEVLVKHKAGASTRIYEMKVEEQLELLEIAGHGFDLEAQRGKDLVFVAMGTGVAPLRSALRHVLKRKQDFGQLVVLYGARTPDDFCFRTETRDWETAGVELRQVISRPDGHDWSGSTGYVQSLLDHVLPDLSSPIALICGSLEMIGQTRDRLRQMGFAADEILTNY